MTAYYNEIDPFAAQWLRNLIAAGHIAPGEVDERSIVEVRPADLAGFDQCHFFAGVGVWSYAIRLAGWSDNRPVWTGSCPCQPFSAAGAGKEFADERHLWPTWFQLIRVCRPVAVFGEQVASRDALAWLDHVCADLEGEGYAVGAVDTCAAGYGAPHIRQRLYWVADGELARLEGYERHGGNGNEPGRIGADATRSIAARGATNGFWADAEWLPCRDGKARPTEPGTFPLAHGATQRVGRLRAYGNCIVAPQAAEFVRAFLECEP